MEKSAKSQFSSDLIHSIRPVAESAEAIDKILTATIEGLQKIQTEICAVSSGNPLLGMAGAMEPGGVSNSLWKFPAWCQTQSVSLVRSMLDSVGILNRSQREILEQMGGSLTQFSRLSAEALAQVNESLFSRRVSAEVFDFPDRRSLAQSAPTDAGEAHAKNGFGQRSSKKSAG